MDEATTEIAHALQTQAKVLISVNEQLGILTKLTKDLNDREQEHFIEMLAFRHAAQSAIAMLFAIEGRHVDDISKLLVETFDAAIGRPPHPEDPSLLIKARERFVEMLPNVSSEAKSISNAPSV